MSAELSGASGGVIEASDVVYVSPVSFYEITQKRRLGKWPELDPVIPRVLPLWREQGTELAAYSAEIAFLAGSMPWSNRDPFDRMIAATAIELACPLISKVTVFDNLTLIQCGRVASGPLRRRTPCQALETQEH